MTTCPHCKHPGVTAWAARWSDRGGPATCSLSDGLSHVLAGTSRGIFVVTAILLFIALFVGIAAMAGGGCIDSGFISPLRDANDCAEALPGFHGSAINERTHQILGMRLGEATTAINYVATGAR